MHNPADLAEMKRHTSPAFQNLMHDTGEASIGSSATRYLVYNNQNICLFPKPHFEAFITKSQTACLIASGNNFTDGSSTASKLVNWLRQQASMEVGLYNSYTVLFHRILGLERFITNTQRVDPSKVGDQ
jgi:hypothetical protein